MSTPVPQEIKTARENYRSALEAQVLAGQAKTQADTHVTTSLQTLLDLIDTAPTYTPPAGDPDPSNPPEGS